MIGDHDEALNRPDTLLSIPSRVSVASLRVDPIYDPLRNDPRFQALLAKYEN